MKFVQLTLWVLLLALIGYEWLDWEERHRQAIEVAAAEEGKSEVSLEAADHQVLHQASQAYRDIADQTLFRSDRTGFQLTEDDGLKSASRPELPRFRLLGVILTESEPPSAMIFDEKLNESRLLHIGDDLDSWELREIGSGYVVLSWRDQLEKIQLRNY